MSASRNAQISNEFRTLSSLSHALHLTFFNFSDFELSSSPTTASSCFMHINKRLVLGGSHVRGLCNKEGNISSSVTSGYIGGWGVRMAAFSVTHFLNDPYLYALKGCIGGGFVWNESSIKIFCYRVSQFSAKIVNQRLVHVFR